MENNLDTELPFDNEPINKFFPTSEFITGSITFFPKRDLEVPLLRFRLVLETRKKIGVQEKILQEEQLTVNKIIHKEEQEIVKNKDSKFSKK